MTTLPNPVKDQMDRPVWLSTMEEKLRPQRRTRRRKKRTAKMEQFFDKTDPSVALLEAYKHANKMKTLGSFEDLVSTVEGAPAVVSVKVDGEIAIVSWDGREARLVSFGGRVRKNLPLTDEIERVLRGKGPSVFVAELFGVDSRGEELPYPKAVSLLRNPQSDDDEKRIRTAVFDVLEYNGKDVSGQDYWKRLTIATNLFGNSTYIGPVYATEDGKSTVEKLWEQKVLDEGHEGLVVRVDGAYKLKPVNTLDLAVVGVRPAEGHPDWAGALLLAFMDDQGDFRDAGKVGTGLTHMDRQEWLRWAKRYKVSEENGNILVDPFAGDKVIEVRFEGLNVKDRPSFFYVDGRYEPTGQKPSSALGKPVVVRIRDDKHVNLDDIRVEQIPQGVLRKAQDEEEGVFWTGEEFKTTEPGVGFEQERLVPTVEPEQEQIEIPWEQMFGQIITSIQVVQSDYGPDGRAVVDIPIDSPLLEHTDELVNISLGPVASSGGYAGALFVVHPDQTMDADYNGYPYAALGVSPDVFVKQLQDYQGELVVQYQPTPVEPVEEREEEPVVRFRPKEIEEEVVPMGLGDVEIEIDPKQYEREWLEIDEYLTSIEDMEQEAEEWTPRFPVIVRISPNSAIGLTEAYSTLQYGSTGPVGKLVQPWGTDADGNPNVVAFIDDILEEGWEVDYRPDERSPEEWAEFVASVSGEQARGTPAAEREKWLARLRPEVEEEAEEKVSPEELSLVDRAEELLGPSPSVDVDLPEGAKREDMPEQYYVAHWVFIDAYNATQPELWRFDTVDTSDVLKLYNIDEDLRKHMDAVMEELGIGSGADNLERILGPNLEEEVPAGEDPEKYIEEELGGKLDLLMEELNRARGDVGEVKVLLNPNFMKIPRYADTLELTKLFIESRVPGTEIVYEDSPDVNFYEGYRIDAEDWQIPFEEYAEVEAPLTQGVTTAYLGLLDAINVFAEEAETVYVYLNPDFNAEYPELIVKLDKETEPNIIFDTDESIPFEWGGRVVSTVPKTPEEVEEKVEEEAVPSEAPPEAATYEQVAGYSPEFIDRYRNAYFDLFMRGEIEEATYNEQDIASAFNLGIGTEESEEVAAASLEDHIKETLQAREKVREEDVRKFPYEDVLRFLRDDVENRRPVIIYVSEGDYPDVYTGGDHADAFAGLDRLDQISLTVNPDLGPGDWAYDLVDLVEKLPPEWQTALEKEEKYGPIREKAVETILKKNKANWDDLERSIQDAYNEAASMVAKLPEEQKTGYLEGVGDGINWLSSIIQYDPGTGQPTNVRALMQPRRANELAEFIEAKQSEIADVWYGVAQQLDLATSEGYRLLAKAYGMDLPRTRYPEGEGPSADEQELVGHGESRAFLRERPTLSEFWDRYYYVHRAYADDYKRGWLDAAYKTGYIPGELTDPNIIGGPRAPEVVEEMPPAELEPAPSPVAEEEYLNVFEGMASALQELVSAYPIAGDVTQLRVRLSPVFLEDSDSRGFFLRQLDDLQTATGYEVNMVPDESVPRSPGFEVVEPLRAAEEEAPAVPEEVLEEVPKIPEEVPEEVPVSPETPPMPGAPPPPKTRAYSEESYENDGRAVGERVFKQYIETADKEAVGEDLWRRWHSIATFANGEPGAGANLWWTGYLRGFESAFLQQDSRWKKFFDDARGQYSTLNEFWTKAKPLERPAPAPKPRIQRELAPAGRGEEIGRYLFNKYMTGTAPPNAVLVDDMFRRRLNQIPVDQRNEWASGVISVVDPEESLGWAEGFRAIVDDIRRTDRLDEIRARVPESMEEAGSDHAEEVLEQGMSAMQVLDQLSKPTFQQRSMDFKQGFWDFFQVHSDPEYRRLGQFLYENLPKEPGIPSSNEAEGRMVADAIQSKLAADPEIRPKILDVYRDYCAKKDKEWVAGFWGALPQEIRTYVEEEYAKHPDWTYTGPAEVKPYMYKPKGKKWTKQDYTDYATDVVDYGQQRGLSPQELAVFIAQNTQHWTPGALVGLLQGLPEEVRQYLPSESEMFSREIGDLFKRLLGSRTITADEPIPQYQPGGLEYMVPYMRGDELAVQYFGRGSEPPSEPVFPFNVGDVGTLQDLEVPIISEYLAELAEERFGIRNFLDVVNRQDPKIIEFIYSESAPDGIWVDDNTLAINLFRVHNIDDLMIVLIHDFAHVMTILAQEPVSDREDRSDATPEEYVEFPEEDTAYQEMIRFMSFILRMPRDAIRDKLLDLVGDSNEEVIDRWIRVTLGAKLPETEEDFFEELVAITANYPEHPDTVIVQSEFYPNGLTEADVWTYYDGVKEELVDELKGQDVMLVVQADGEIYRRHPDSKQESIQINNSIDFDKFNNGRTIEFHKVVEEITPYGYVDIDPKENVDFAQAKRLAFDVYGELEKLPDVSSVELAYSGGRGFHAYLNYSEPKPVDTARRELRDAMNEYIERTGDEKLTTGIAREADMIRLDTTTLHRTGSLRVPGSLNAKTGLICTSVLPGELSGFKKESAKINTAALVTASV